MKRFAALMLAALTLGGLAVGGDAQAHDRHFRGHLGVYIGAPIIYPWGYAPYYGPYYRPYPPPVYRVPEAPTVYIERGTAPGSDGYWYYCGSVKGYYPYVKECPEGWQRVVPTPPPPG